MKEIEKIIERYIHTDWSLEKMALGTVVKVEESSYRRIGARILVSSNGNWIGGISGGCLEGDALKRAQIAISKNQSSIVVYDTMEDDAHQIGVGLGCNGRIEVMFTPIDQKDLNNPIEQLIKIVNSREPTIFLQILAGKEIDKQLIGKVYSEFNADQLIAATQINQEMLQNSIEMVRAKGKSKVHPIGDLEILVEMLRPRVKLLIIGDNYDVNAFVNIGNEMGWEVHVAGKKRKLGKHVFTTAKSVSEINEIEQISLDRHTAVILMSHDYKTDHQLIQYFVKRDIRYIGMLGPKKRMIKMHNEFQEMENPIDLQSVSNFYAPVGLDLGAESPEEIALSIAAEIISVFRNRGGTSLRERQGPIHERD